MVGLARIAVSEVYDSASGEAVFPEHMMPLAFRNISISTGMSSYVAFLIMSDYLIQLR